MYMTYSRRLAASMGISSQSWLSRVPPSPFWIDGAYDRLLSALGAKSGPRSIPLRVAHDAIDELMGTDEFKSLTKRQRAVVGCAFIELAAVHRGIGRGFPTILMAIRYISLAMNEYNLAGLHCLSSAFHKLYSAQGLKHPLTELERALIAVVIYILDAKCRPIGCGGALDPKVRHALSSNCGYFNRAKLSRLRRSVLASKCIPRSVRIEVARIRLPRRVARIRWRHNLNHL